MTKTSLKKTTLALAATGATAVEVMILKHLKKSKAGRRAQVGKSEQRLLKTGAGELHKAGRQEESAATRLATDPFERYALVDYDDDCLDSGTIKADAQFHCKKVGTAGADSGPVEVCSGLMENGDSPCNGADQTDTGKCQWDADNGKCKFRDFVAENNQGFQHCRTHADEAACNGAAAETIPFGGSCFWRSEVSACVFTPECLDDPAPAAGGSCINPASPRNRAAFGDWGIGLVSADGKTGCGAIETEGACNAYPNCLWDDDAAATPQCTVKRAANDITPTAGNVTVSSTYSSTTSKQNLVDGNLLGNPFNSADGEDGEDAPAQKCPWVQLELPNESTQVGHVELTTLLHSDYALNRLRRLFFRKKILNFAGDKTWNATDGNLPEGSLDTEQNSGIRVLVTNNKRDVPAAGRGDACAEPAKVCNSRNGACYDFEVCEHIICKEGEGATCKNRFVVPEGMPPDAGTATVDCRGKMGKYLTIELPGIEENPGAGDPEFRILNLNEVKVFRPSAPPEPKDITPSADAITASSEFNEDHDVDFLVDGDLSGLVFNTADNNYGSPGQHCPWVQLELSGVSTGAKVGAVELTSYISGDGLFRLRRLFFDKKYDGNTWNATDPAKIESNVTDQQNAGFRVLLQSEPRDRSATSRWFHQYVTHKETGVTRIREWWQGTGKGETCDALSTSSAAQVCEHVVCEIGETCKDQFVPDATIDGVGTATVDCGGKEGKYLIIELPGVVPGDSPDTRILNLNEVKVFAFARRRSLQHTGRG
ncbi:unnamed protein product [Amoebophrya sp. A120]|nr:unnamed protein product [Amoebophrya sp. A120]|eukprot:GSA120T00025602001.1